MARIETDPNYSSPTFSRATAATDIFKKEDVQALAAAMSTHVHDGAGKGLAIAATGIPAGSITSAMIADGTITSVDLAAHAASATYLSPGVAVSPATTSLVAVDMPDMICTFSMGVVGDLRILFTTSVQVTGGTYAIFTLLCDGAAVMAGYVQQLGINVTLCLTGAVLSASAATHTVKVQWYLASAGTLTANSTTRALVVGVQSR